MDGGPLQHPLDADGLLGLGPHPLGKLLHRVLEERLQPLAESLHRSAAGGQHLLRLRLLTEGEQKVLQRQVFVPHRLCVLQCLAEAGLQLLGD